MANTFPHDLLSQTWTFDTARTAWLHARQNEDIHSDVADRDSASAPLESADELAFAVTEAAEVFLLDVSPTDPLHVITILDVLLEQPDFRVDGRDRSALQNVRTFVDQRLEVGAAPMG